MWENKILYWKLTSVILNKHSVIHILTVYILLSADDSEETNKVAHYMTDDKSSKNPVEIEDEEVYAIPERLYDRIENFLVCCL